MEVTYSTGGVIDVLKPGQVAVVVKQPSEDTRVAGVGVAIHYNEKGYLTYLNSCEKVSFMYTENKGEEWMIFDK